MKKFQHFKGWRQNKEPFLLATPLVMSAKREYYENSSTLKSWDWKQLAGCAPNRAPNRPSVCGHILCFLPAPPPDSYLRSANRIKWIKWIQHSVSPRWTVRYRKYGFFLPCIWLQPMEILQPSHYSWGWGNKERRAAGHARGDTEAQTQSLDTFYQGQGPTFLLVRGRLTREWETWPGTNQQSYATF